MAADDLALYVDTDLGLAETVTLAGSDVDGIFDTASELVADGVVGYSPTFRGLTAALTAAASGQTLVRAGNNYLVRQVLKMPPDGEITQLVLARA